MSLSHELRAFFARNGYVVLPRDTIAPDELREFQTCFDHDFTQCNWAWRLFGGHQTINCDALATSPAIDRAIRHPRILGPIRELMGGPVCFSEICLRHMKPYQGEPSQSWHRDRPHWTSHPLRMDYLQCMIYLTDVHEGTHCFSISPEAIDEPVTDNRTEQFARRGTVDLHGPAGSVILFNIACLHTATVRRTSSERRTIQTYYGHLDRPYLSDDSLIPAALWRDAADEETREFYGVLNRRTRLFLGLKNDA